MTVALERHPASPAVVAAAIAVEVQRAGGMLELRYVLDAPPGSVRVPALAPARFEIALWQHTCFEAFVAIDGGRAYHEWNLSPSRAWAAHSFRDVRQGGPVEDVRLAPHISVLSAREPGAPSLPLGSARAEGASEGESTTAKSGSPPSKELRVSPPHPAASPPTSPQKGEVGIRLSPLGRDRAEGASEGEDTAPSRHTVAKRRKDAHPRLCDELSSTGRGGLHRGHLVLEARIDLAAISAAHAGACLRVGLAAVVEGSDGRLEYWALRHASAKPDFHQPASFALRLEPSGEAVVVPQS